MAFRKFIIGILLFIASIHGHDEPGDLETSNKDLSGSGDAEPPSTANFEAADEVSSKEGKTNFVGVNICGFDFGW